MGSTQSAPARGATGSLVGVSYAAAFARRLAGYLGL